MYNTATATIVARIYHKETYMCFSYLVSIVTKTLIANNTHATTTQRSTNHSNSAYPIEWL